MSGLGDYPIVYVPINGADRAAIEEDARFYQDMAAAAHQIVEILMRRADTGFFPHDSWKFYSDLRHLHAGKARLALARLLVADKKRRLEAEIG